MRIALAVPQLQARWQDNLARIRAMTRAAARDGAQFVVFSEAALTGFVNTGDPVSDLALGHTVPGPVTIDLADLAHELQVWLVVGLFECDATRLYDSALLFAPDGTVRLHYRRIDPHWHHWFARPGDTLPYTQGVQLESVVTPLGRCSILLCGDLFNDACQQRVTQLQPDWLIVPMARGFDSEVADSAEWYATARTPYLEAAQTMGVKLLLVNQLAALEPDAHYFGGALVATAGGKIVAEQPIERAGVLLVDL